MRSPPGSQAGSNDAEFDMGKWMDVNMLVMATAREFRLLLDQAGFDLVGIVATLSPLSSVIGKPRG